jgi:plastocyanin
MKPNRFFVIISIFLLTICFAGFSTAAEEEAPQAEATEAEELKVVNKIVRISEKEGAFPQTLFAKPGTTVIWVNNARSILEVQFLDKKVTLACGSPVNFFINADGAYESGKIPFGGTASLCFLEPGTYDYMLRVNRTWYKPAQGGLGKDHRGRIEIKSE